MSDTDVVDSPGWGLIEIWVFDQETDGTISKTFVAARTDVPVDVEIRFPDGHRFRYSREID